MPFSWLHTLLYRYSGGLYFSFSKRWLLCVFLLILSTHVVHFRLGVLSRAHSVNPKHPLNSSEELSESLASTFSFSIHRILLLFSSLVWHLASRSLESYCFPVPWLLQFVRIRDAMLDSIFWKDFLVLLLLFFFNTWFTFRNSWSLSKTDILIVICISGWPLGIRMGVKEALYQARHV